MRILVLGGDGYCGWPAALYFSDRGHDVGIVDNFSRRRIADQLKADSLTPLQSMEDRIRAWREVSGRKLDFFFCNLAIDSGRMIDVIRVFRPDAVIHFAEQRSAPYSMKSIEEKNYTLQNNLLATHNVLNAIVSAAPAAHLVHLGSIGTYGYEDRTYQIPASPFECSFRTTEGNQASLTIQHPHLPGSIYHLSKTIDASVFNLYAKLYGLAITDLYQGVVWGGQTKQTLRHPHLLNRFDYDGCYGTVLNRFLVQAALDEPITVYGKGGQTRAFINIEDTFHCIEMALKNRPLSGVDVKHQATEKFRISDLAKLVAELTGARVEHIENPRVESEDHRFDVDMSYFIGNGLQPTELNHRIVGELTENILRHRDRIDLKQILPQIQWR